MFSGKKTSGMVLDFFFEDKLSRIARGSHLVAACRAAEAVATSQPYVWWIARVIRPSKSKVKMAHSAPVPCNAWNAWKILGEKKVGRHQVVGKLPRKDSGEAKMDYCFNKSLLRGKIER